MAEINIVVGSTLGGAEYVADHVSEVLSAQDISHQILPNPTLAEIAQTTSLLVITSTYGAGELPDNIKPLFEELAKSEVNLSAMKFGVIGLGSSDYDTFCNAVNIVEHTLTEKGAAQICESLRIDVVNNFDHDESAENWLPSFLSAL
jgi:MioC protein